MTTEKKVSLDLTTVNGNAFAIMGAFQRQARREDWVEEEIQLVLEEMMNGDYDHLLQTAIKYTR